MMIGLNLADLVVPMARFKSLLFLCFVCLFYVGFHFMLSGCFWILCYYIFFLANFSLKVSDLLVLYWSLVVLGLPV